MKQKILCYIAFTFVIVSCHTAPQNKSQNSIYDGKYDTYAPGQGSSEYLERISRSVKLVSALFFYESYDFKPEESISLKDINKKFLHSNSERRLIFEKPAIGTATILYYQNHHLALLTCAHIVHSADTVVTYHLDNEGNETPYIRTISILKNSRINVIKLPDGNNMNILAIDLEKDVALIGKKISTRFMQPVYIFSYPFGRARELEWATFVYLFGYPFGKKMLTQALVSNPNYDKKHSFLLNANSHRGISGGIILALRDGIPNFELMGMAYAFPAETQKVLKPKKDFHMPATEFRQLYEGQLYVEQQTSVIHGIMYVISSETICSFLAQHQESLKSRGYLLNYPCKK